MIFGFTEKSPLTKICLFGNFEGALMFFRKFLEKIEKYHKGNPYVKSTRKFQNFGDPKKTVL